MSLGMRGADAAARTRLLALLVLLASASAQVGLQRVLDAGLQLKPAEHMRVPSLAVALAQGFMRRRAAADIQWIRATSYAGDARFNRDGHRALPALLRLVVTLDPSMSTAYYLGGVLLASHPGTADAATELWRLGEARFRDRWVFPMMIGACALFDRGEEACR